MKKLVMVLLATAALNASAFAQTGNIAGTEYSGEPLNSSVRSSGKNPYTGLTPGGERSLGVGSGVRAYGQVHTRKVCWRDDFGRRHCRWR